MYVLVMRVRALRIILSVVFCVTLFLSTPGESVAFVPVDKFCPDGMWSPVVSLNCFMGCPDSYHAVESLGSCLWHLGILGSGILSKERASQLCNIFGRLAVPKTEGENTAMREFVQWSQDNVNQDPRSAWPAWSNAETAYQNSYCTEEFTELLCESDYLCVDMPAV